MPAKWKKAAGYWKPGRSISVTVVTGDCSGRWDLEHDHHPDQAIAALRTALVDFPHDWRIHYRLARALQIVNHTEEAHREAETVGRIRELLDPLTLGPKLDAALSHLDQPSALQTLAKICDRVGLTRLAGFWREAGAAHHDGHGHGSA